MGEAAQRRAYASTSGRIIEHIGDAFLAVPPHSMTSCQASLDSTAAAGGPVAAAATLRDWVSMGVSHAASRRLLAHPRQRRCSVCAALYGAAAADRSARRCLASCKIASRERTSLRRPPSETFFVDVAEKSITHGRR